VIAALNLADYGSILNVFRIVAFYETQPIAYNDHGSQNNKADYRIL
jgi:hypothetical protein